MDDDEEAEAKGPKLKKARKAPQQEQQKMAMIPIAVKTFYIMPDVEEWAKLPVGQSVLVTREPMECAITDFSKLEGGGKGEKREKKITPLRSLMNNYEKKTGDGNEKAGEAAAESAPAESVPADSTAEEMTGTETAGRKERKKPDWATMSSHLLG